MSTSSIHSPTLPLTSAPHEPEGVIELRDFGWKNYLRLYRLLEGRRSPKLIYLDGDLTLLSPISFEHEFSSRSLFLTVLEVALGLDIPIAYAGQTTFRRRSKRVAVQGDETFYLGANESLIRGKKRIDLRNDPPPDLAIEVVVTHPADKSVRIWKRLGVREIWIVNDRGMLILSRIDDGTYADVQVSLVLPTLSAVEIHDWATRSTATAENVWLLDLRTWVRDVLIPRAAQNGD